MTPSKKTKLLRFGGLLLLLALLYVAGSASGLMDVVSLEWIRAQVEAAGAWGILVYLGIFCGAVLLWVPGLLFAVAGIVIYGPWLGAPLALLGMCLSSSIQVVVFRQVGGDLLLDSQRPLLQRSMARLHDQPLRSIALLRLFLAVNPPLNTALAMSGVSFRHNFLGTAVGMVPMTIVIATAVEPILLWIAGRA